MTDHNEKKLETGKKYIERLEITPKNKKSILQFIEQLSAENLTLIRQIKYLYAFGTICKLLDGKDFSKLTKQDMMSYCSKVNNSKYTEWTKRDFKIMIKRFMKWLREHEGQEFDKHEYPSEVKWITTTVKENKLGYSKKLLTFEDALKLSEATNNLRDRCLVLLLYESGARIGEIMSIRIKDVTFEQWGASILIPKSKTKSRTIFIHRSAPAISNWLMDHPDRNNEDSPLFCGMWSKKRGKEIVNQTIRYMLLVAAEKAKIKKPVNPHNFRHSRATELADSLSNSQLCNYLGWKQGSRELATYISMKDTKDAILKLNGIEKKDEKTEKHKVVTCPRCGIVNSPDSKFCSHCSLGLELQSVMDYEKISKETLKTIDDPVKFELMLKPLIEQLEQQKRKIEQLEKEKYQ